MIKKGRYDIYDISNKINNQCGQSQCRYSYWKSISIKSSMYKPVR